MSQGLSSRLCAVNALHAVFESQKPLDQCLDKFATKYNLSAQDKSFAHALCGFVLRYKSSLQSIVNKQANRKRDIDPPHLNIVLLMGVAQIYLMDGVANHAAVDISVELTTHIKCPKQKGLVNAILRNLIRGETPDLKPSIPEWLIKTWKQDYGDEVAQKIAEASLCEAKIGISNKDGEWCIRDRWTNLSADEWVQDYASYMPVSLLDEELDGVTVLDLCAAPGGKTMQLAAKGAKVTSIDISEKRLKRLQDNLKRTNLNAYVEVICTDILKYKPQQKFDIILLDAPCSATGTIRRHPDLPFIRTEADIKALVDLQAQLLNHITDWVKPNGTLLYCTCSLQKDEGERQVERFLQSNNNFNRTALTQHKNYQTDDGDIRMMPHYGDMDGFFISMMMKY